MSEEYWLCPDCGWTGEVTDPDQRPGPRDAACPICGDDVEVV